MKENRIPKGVIYIYIYIYEFGNNKTEVDQEIDGKMREDGRIVGEG